MKNKKPSTIKKRLLNAYVVSTLSITLVLFLIGVFSLLVLNARYLNNYIRENIGISLVLNENVKEVDLLQLQKILAAQTEVKSANYIDSETAAQLLQEDLGEDFVSFLGYNPLQATIDIKLFAAYTHNDSLINLEQKLLNYPYVEEVYYQRNMVGLINDNTNKVGFIVLALGVVMLLIFFTLINNTIRLSVYSKRFLINTMKLVGATPGFIRKPFVSRSVLHGLLGSILANTLLLALTYSLYKQFNEVLDFNATNVILLVFAVVIVSGVLISWLSTTLAVNKFLKLRYDELFN